MLDSHNHHRYAWSWVAWLLTLVLQPCLSAAQANLPFPATVEVDLIFPNNDTYAPATLMPIVFAIQNAPYAAALDLSLEYLIWRLDANGSPEGNATGGEGIIHLRGANLSATSTFFTYQYSSSLNINATSWALVWTLGSGNCSHSQSSQPISYNNTNNNVVFRTESGGLSPDLVAATAEGICTNNAQSFTFNITENVPRPIDSSPFGPQPANSCAVLSDAEPFPPANPCGVKLDPSAASSISAAITATECAAPHPLVTCPPKSAASRRLASVGEGLGWMVLGCGWVACMFLF